MDRQQMREYEAEQRRREMAAEGREERTMGTLKSFTVRAVTPDGRPYQQRDGRIERHAGVWYVWYQDWDADQSYVPASCSVAGTLEEALTDFLWWSGYFEPDFDEETREWVEPDMRLDLTPTASRGQATAPLYGTAEGRRRI
jgi:hypothetical protein